MPTVTFMREGFEPAVVRIEDHAYVHPQFEEILARSNAQCAIGVDCPFAVVAMATEDIAAVSLVDLAVIRDEHGQLLSVLHKVIAAKKRISIMVDHYHKRTPKVIEAMKRYQELVDALQQAGVPRERIYKWQVPCCTGECDRKSS